MFDDVHEVCFGVRLTENFTAQMDEASVIKAFRVSYDGRWQNE